MSFTQTDIQRARHKYLIYQATGGSAANTNSTMEEFMVFSQAFELEKIRLRLSVAHVSIVDFMAYISDRNNSYYNHNLVSQAMLGVRDYMIQFNPTLKLRPSDCLQLSMVYSAANHYGVEFCGWAVTIPSGGG